MVELKTKENNGSVEDFLSTIEDEEKRRDSFTILQMMKESSHHEPRMWGSSIIGFGRQHYKYETGREGDWFLIGFSPRKQNLTLYFTDGIERHQLLLEKLGKYKIGKSCLYIKKIKEIDLPTLKQLMESSLKQLSHKSK